MDAKHTNDVEQVEVKKTTEVILPKRERVFEERTVIDEKLIIEAVMKYRKQHLDETIQELTAEEDVDLDKLDMVELTHSMIYRIAHLESYTCMTKLVLNSNIIEKIEGLDTLVNLKWLDLSFNKISRIENLDKLVNLTDLSLHKNNIKKIEGLDNLKKLEILSLGDNKIAEMSNIHSLRPFKSLKVLSLKGNPVAADETYVANVIAFLEQVQYLDYKFLVPTDQQKGYRPTELETILKEEKKSKKVEELKIKREAENKIDTAMNAAGLRTLYDDMITADKAYEKICQLTNINVTFKSDVLQKYEQSFRKAIEDYYTECEAIHEKRDDEEKLYKAAVEKADKLSKDNSVALIQEFEAKKNIAIENYGDADGESDELDKLKEELKILEQKLMEGEMLLVEQLSTVNDVFTKKMRELKDRSNSK